MSRVLSMNKWDPRMAGKGFSQFSEMLDEYQRGQFTGRGTRVQVARHAEERCELL